MDVDFWRNIKNGYRDLNDFKTNLCEKNLVYIWQTLGA